MTWFKVDDSFYDHPKIFDAPDCAVALWIRAGCWAARTPTDGFVPLNMPARLCDDPDTAVRQLLDRGLWSRTRGGYLFHDWHDYQPSAERVKKTRQARAENGRKGGQAKAANAGKQTASNLPEPSQDFAKQNAAPTRPDPKPPMADLVSQLPVAGARAYRDDDSIISAVVAAAEPLAGRPVTADEARSAIGVIAERAERDGTEIHHPPQYFAKCVLDEPDVYALLLADQLAAIEAEDAGIPRWCGDCDEETRQLDRYGDHPRRCPICNPQTLRRSA